MLSQPQRRRSQLISAEVHGSFRLAADPNEGARRAFVIIGHRQTFALLDADHKMHLLASAVTRVEDCRVVGGGNWPSQSGTVEVSNRAGRSRLIHLQLRWPQLPHWAEDARHAACEAGGGGAEASSTHEWEGLAFNSSYVEVFDLVGQALQLAFKEGHVEHGLEVKDSTRDELCKGVLVPNRLLGTVELCQEVQLLQASPDKSILPLENAAFFLTPEARGAAALRLYTVTLQLCYSLLRLLHISLQLLGGFARI